jgi:acyl carrier protein
MESTAARLTRCFQAVFPNLSAPEILSASHEGLSAWDSTAGIILMNVIEEEFGIQADFDRLAELDSFERILEYVDAARNSAAH